MRTDTVHYRGKATPIARLGDKELRDVVCDTVEAFDRAVELLDGMKDVEHWCTRDEPLTDAWERVMHSTAPLPPPRGDTARQARWQGCQVRVPGRRSLNHTVASLDRQDLEAVLARHQQAMGRWQAIVEMMQKEQARFDQGGRIQPECKKDTAPVVPSPRGPRR